MSEGLEVLDAINEALCDDRGRPLQNIRIRHTILLDDPFPDPPQLAEHIPDASPEPVYAAVRVVTSLDPGLGILKSSSQATEHAHPGPGIDVEWIHPSKVHVDPCIIAKGLPHEIWEF